MTKEDLDNLWNKEYEITPSLAQTFERVKIHFKNK